MSEEFIPVSSIPVHKAVKVTTQYGQEQNEPQLSPPIRIAKVTNIIRKSSDDESATPRTKSAMQSLMELSSSSEKEQKSKKRLRIDTTSSDDVTTPSSQSPPLALPANVAAPMAVPMMNMYPELLSVMQVAQSPSELEMVQKAFLAGLQSQTPQMSPIPYTPSMTPSSHGGYFSLSPGVMNTTMMMPSSQHLPQQQMAYNAVPYHPGDISAMHHAQYLSFAYNSHLSRAYATNPYVTFSLSLLFLYSFKYCTDTHTHTHKM